MAQPGLGFQFKVNNVSFINFQVVHSPPGEDVKVQYFKRARIQEYWCLSEIPWYINKSDMIWPLAQPDIIAVGRKREVYMFREL